MTYIEAKGKKRSQKQKELHHLRIFAGEDANRDHPSWIVEHVFANRDHKPKAHEFDNHREMLAHVEKHTGTSEPAEE